MTFIPSSSQEDGQRNEQDEHNGENNDNHDTKKHTALLHELCHSFRLSRYPLHVYIIDSVSDIAQEMTKNTTLWDSYPIRTIHFIS